MTQAALGKALGVGQTAVSRMVARGMPTDSVAAAKAWRLANTTEGIGHKSGSPSVTEAVKAMTAETVAPPLSAGPTQPDDPAGTLARMRETEQRVYALINAALVKAKQSQQAEDYAALPGLIRSYNQAGANSLAAASAWEKHCRASGELAPVEHLVNVLTSRLEPLAAQLRNFAATVAPTANPTAPSIAESAIREHMTGILTQLTAAQAPVPRAPAPTA